MFSKIRLFWSSAGNFAALSELQHSRLDWGSMVSHRLGSWRHGFWGWLCVLCQFWNASFLTGFRCVVWSDKLKHHSDSACYDGFHVAEPLQSSQNTVIVGGHYWFTIFLHWSSELCSFASVSTSSSIVAPYGVVFWFLWLELWGWRGWGALWLVALKGWSWLLKPRAAFV